MKHIITLITFIVAPFLIQAQVESRTIFIGNSGKESKQQKRILADASERVIEGKSDVFFMGDNLYRRGLKVKQGKFKQKQKAFLMKQYQPFVDREAEVYFLPGDRDWNNSGNKGLKSVQEQSRFLNGIHKSVSMLPEGGCPGPVEKKISKNLSLLIMDSEWWLFPFDKENKKCKYSSKGAVEQEVRKIINRNLDKNLILVSHHPFQSHGKYGNKFTWKDHLFPLTNLHKNLYVPLPGAGSLYPIFKKSFPDREVLSNAHYQELKRMVGDPFKGFPNAMHISAHDDGLQFIQDSTENLKQLITAIGGSAKIDIKKKDKAVFQKNTSGYIVVDQLKNKNLHYKFYGLVEGEIKKVYEFTQEYQPREEWNNKTYTPIKEDTVMASTYSKYNEVKKFHRQMIGENFRDAWAKEVKLPVIRLSEYKGGMTYRKMGGGHQTINMRLRDTLGNQYALRSVVKTVNRVIPDQFETSFTRELVDHFYSSQHPYSALMVPPIAEAVEVPHAKPIIGVVSADTVLAEQAHRIAGEVFLLEEWEPYQPTDNFKKAFKNLVEDSGNRFDGINFLQARMLDLLIGDWDRDEAQWRFHNRAEAGQNKDYLIVPRDRDMVLNVTEGTAVGFGKKMILTPHIYGFNTKLLNQANWYLYNSDFLNAQPDAQINYDRWMGEAYKFKNNVTDSVLKASVNAMPKGLDEKENQKIYKTLKKRRDRLPEAMKNYYKFINKIIDIRGSNKNEWVEVVDLEDDKGLQVTMRKIDDEEKPREILMKKKYLAKHTKEIRIYLEEGKDSVFVNAENSKIKLRIIGGKSEEGTQKSYHIENSKKKIRIYDYQEEQYTGKTDRLKVKVSKDKKHTEFVPIELYPGQDDMNPNEANEGPDRGVHPILSAGYNKDDGVALTLGVEFNQYTGFRKTKEIGTHRFIYKHATHTGASEFIYQSDWKNVFGTTDILFNAGVKAPAKQNFFGLGNESLFKETGHSYKYFRTDYVLYDVDLAFSWNWHRQNFNIGPAYQRYHYKSGHNQGNFADRNNEIEKGIANKKSYLGFEAHYELDNRDNEMLTVKGLRLKSNLKTYYGTDHNSHAFISFSPEFSFHQNLNSQETVILSNRTGGQITAGNAPFYEHAFIGGKDYLLGYRQYRFGGEHSLYNNTEMRLVLSDFANTLFKGQIGLTGFVDVGRVWAKGEHSRQWHNSVGAGAYIAPAYATVINFNMGYSNSEGWYPYIKTRLRF